MSPLDAPRDARPKPPPGAARVRATLAGVVFASYVAVANAALNFYPFSTFDMYARHASSGSRIVGRLADGRVVEVARYTGWACDRAVDVRAERCGDPPRFYYIPYKDDEAAHWIATHRADESANAVAIDVVRRVWWFDTPASQPRPEDCLVARCRASTP